MNIPRNNFFFFSPYWISGFTFPVQLLWILNWMSPCTGDSFLECQQYFCRWVNYTPLASCSQPVEVSVWLAALRGWYFCTSCKVSFFTLGGSHWSLLRWQWWRSSCSCKPVACFLCGGVPRLLCLGSMAQLLLERAPVGTQGRRG